MPVAIGGSLFRHEATGAGVDGDLARVRAVELTLSDQRCVVQGSGTSAVSQRPS